MSKAIRSKILIVDDLPENVGLLFQFLTAHNFKVLVAQNGESALQLVEHDLPDLILLDVMMPGIDGFETCKRLKRIDKIQNIPIIFMTALADTADKVKGLKLGAADYITKPIQHEEVLARINTHLMLQEQQRQLQWHNEQLQEILVKLSERTMQLERRNSELDSFAHTVAHDLKNPLSGIVSLCELLLWKDCADQAKAKERLEMVVLAGKRMFDIIDALLKLASVSRQSNVNREPLHMTTVIQQVMQQRLAAMIEKYQADIRLPVEWPTAIGYAPWVEEIWANYVSNGLKYGGHPPKLELGATEQNDGMIRFWIRDNGEGLSVEAQAQLFTPFTRLPSKVDGHGLGLSIVQQIAEKLGGAVGINSQLGQGCEFYFTLPKAVADA